MTDTEPAARLVSPDEARTLREAATPGPWRNRVPLAPEAVIAADDHLVAYPSAQRANGGLDDARLIAIAPDLTHTVEQQAEQIRFLTAQRDRARREWGRLSELVDELHARLPQSLPRRPDRDRITSALVHAEDPWQKATAAEIAEIIAPLVAAARTEGACDPHCLHCQDYREQKAGRLLLGMDHDDWPPAPNPYRTALDLVTDQETQR